MAEDTDREARSEEATEKRLSDAVEKGNVPFSREAVTCGSLIACLMALSLVGPLAAARVSVGLSSVLDGAGTIHLEDREEAAILLTAVLRVASLGILPVMLLLMAGGLIAALAQNMPRASLERISPQLARISPTAGFKRLFGLQGLIEFSKSLLKLVAVCAAAGLAIRGGLANMLNGLETEPQFLPRLALDLVIKLLMMLCSLAALLAAGDLVWSRIKWRRDLRMTRQEVKDEYKQAEGDQTLKHKARTAARQRISRRMMANLPNATVIVTNPTHFAVALRYVREEGGAPVVMAKGADHLAFRIRTLAAEHDIPIVENKPLARGLYDAVEVDQMIPEEFYKAVAEIIHFLQLRRMYRSPLS
ncbi:flagellar biosynthesis protein FlhB [Aestuariivirga sp.]|uniref:flagellar biosynthesis protein FlhB n=1 Tax=Aestuariivirga sp. TaxID=2650926 RepID=UPI0039E5A983